MTELIGCELLHRLDALLVEEFHIVAGGAIEEIVGAHAEPEEVNFLVGIAGIVIDLGNIGRGERAVTAQVAELVEVGQTVEQCLVAATRETADGAVVAVVDGAIVRLNVRHKVIDEILAEHIAAELHLGSTLCGSLGEQLGGVAIGQHNNHLLGLFVGQQVVEDVVHASYLIIDLLRVGGTADEVEYGVLLLLIRLVGRGQIDNGIVGAAKALREVMDVLYASVRHVANVVRQRAVLRRNLQQAVLEALIGEVQLVLGIHHTDTIDNEAIGIHVGGYGAEGHRPCAVGTLGHLLAACELHIDHHILC